MAKWLVVGLFLAALSGLACDAPVRDPSPVAPGKVGALQVAVINTNSVNNGVINPSGGTTLSVTNLSVVNTTTTPQCTVDSDCTGVVTPTSVCQTPACSSGSCTLVASSATTCDDGNACTYGDKCSAGTCAGTAITCTDSTTDPCHHLTCNGTATCASSPLTGAACDDHNSCTKNDTCSNG